MAGPRRWGGRILSRGGGGLVLALAACPARPPSPPTEVSPPPEVSSPPEVPPPASFLREPDVAPPVPITCATVTGHRRLLTVDWTPAEREALSKGLSRGLAVVRLTGCTLALLPKCHVSAGRYVYTPRPPFEYSLVIDPDVSVWIANTPRWGGEQRPRDFLSELAVDIVTAGRYRAAPIDLRRAALVGDCDGATHVVSAIEVGALGHPTSTAGSGCRRGHFADAQPQPRCATPWSVQLLALDPHAPLGPPCPAPLHWNGLACARDRDRLTSHTCIVASPDHPACDRGWPDLPPEDPWHMLVPERLEPAMIDAVMEVARDAVDRCGARTGQPAGTRVQLHLRVDGPTGQVRAARALGAAGHRPLQQCAVDAMRAVQFETTLATDQKFTHTLTTR